MEFASKTKENELQLLDRSEYTIAKPFFRDFSLNEPLLYSVLERRSIGKVFTDDKRNPSFMLVSSPAGYVFLEGSPSQDSLRKVVSYSKTLPHVSFICPLDWKYRSFFEEAGFTKVLRIQFQRPEPFINVDSWKQSLPVKYSITRIGKENFPRCTWYDFILSCYGEIDHFFENGVGFCLVDREKIVSECYGVIASKKAEIGVITDEMYRGQNLGTILSAIMLDYCYKHNIEPLWSCHEDNPSSRAVAKKLGFEERLRYFYLKWKDPQRPS
jgi:RimJ/RimL family protein N-acetyltransferase